ncbi:MAG: DUF177 domain-containing protein [Tissierellia bacterium]|nr:DUF177 domain-containing protein [Tissierellia bacterium]
MNRDISRFLSSGDIHTQITDKLYENTSSYDIEGLGLIFPIAFDIHLYKVDQELELALSVEFEYETQCARCTKPLREKVKSQAELRLSENPEMIDEEYEEEILFLGSLKILPIGDLVMSQVISSRPFKSLCQDDCQGICPQCGQDLNIKSCDCTMTSEINPFEELQGLFSDDKEV